MVNRRSSSPGGFRQVEARGQISAPISGVVPVSGVAGAAVASVFNGLGEQLGRMADRAAAREGEAAGLAAGAAAGAAHVPEVASPAPPSRVAGTSADLDGLSGGARALLDGITGAGVVPELRVTSGYRNPARNAAVGGARGSQHLHGEALDIDISGYSDDQKAALLSAAVASGARGVGIYKSGNSLHVDARENPAVWGSAGNAYAGHSVDQAPPWAQPALRTMFGEPAARAMPASASAPRMALRRDGTIAGEAYDAAAERAFSWRFAAGVDAALTSAFDQHQDDPNGFSAALNDAREALFKDPNLADPEIREAAERQFTSRALTYSQQIEKRAIARQRADMSAAADEQHEAAKGDLERRAFVLASSPEGDAELEREIRRNSAIIDGQAASGSIAPAEAMRRRRELMDVAARARVRGAFEQLPDLAAKEQFASGLTAAWGEKKGPLAALDYSTVYGLQNELIGKARNERNIERRSSAQGRLELTSAIRADVASLRETGAPVLVGGRELEFDDVRQILGAPAAVKWADDRQQARTLYQATADFGVLPEGEIEARLAELEPRPGDVEFAGAAKVRDDARKRAKSLLDRRRTDPAAAVDEAFDAVRAAKDALNPNNPSSYRDLAALRMDAQSQLGIPDLARQPLTKREAQAIALDITRAPNPDRAALDVGRQVVERYGDQADEVLAQVLRSAGSEREASATAAAVLRRAGVGQPVTVNPAVDDAARADAAATAQAPGRPAAFKEVPSYQSIRQLIDNPALGPTFDARFGAGWAQFYLDMQRSAAPAPDDGESWSPAP
ncbi:D-Ala-D-Ala carboxypeptidase family metallohydrolase [Ancylobacter sp. A5.8]|uniref:D-Ala-D-Ala carboxypeptidase family metallohydrolase n=1 Tax=Ancylobacter gelatini TaxID=2919920 RepID=UPI001F4E5473|nr:D-Ala-D-Ala carboxypeptidase family metallohydrolase [Ancylobacter gelatini]MCJ8143812.1 D-Ala-D-Ala carboxypeptidase family metallohydrolase [Ancylobacter gelatini]